jgi:hypothetical protein
MKTLKDSSEIHEAARLFVELSRPVASTPILQLAPDDESEQLIGSARPVWTRLFAVIDDDAPASEKDERGFARLDEFLVNLCEEGGFFGAMVLNDERVIDAVFHTPQTPSAMAALATVIGGAMKTAAAALSAKSGEFSHAAVGVGDKVVARRIIVSEAPFAVAVFCPDGTDEKAAVEEGIGELISLLVHLDIDP